MNQEQAHRYMLLLRTIIIAALILGGSWVAVSYINRQKVYVQVTPTVSIQTAVAVAVAQTQAVGQPPSTAAAILRTSSATPLPATFIPTPIPPTAAPPTLTPAPKSGDVLYQADWSKGANGWVGSKDWKFAGGMMFSDGTTYSATADSWIAAPYLPKTADYAIEVEMQDVTPDCRKAGGHDDFGLVARAGSTGGISVGYYCAAGPLRSDPAGGFGIATNSYYGLSEDQKPYPMDSAWHIYRLEAQGNKITLFMDGAQRLAVMTNKFLDVGKVGLFSTGAQVSVRSFKVIAL